MAEFEKAILAQSAPFMLASQAKQLIQQELIKGCDPVIWPQPVALEPIYSQVMFSREFPIEPNLPLVTYENKPSIEDIIRFKIWISPDQPLDWLRAELFLKQLASVKSRVGLEIIGNQTSVCINLLCRRDDSDIVEAAFSGKLKNHKITPIEPDIFSTINLAAWSNIEFFDYYPAGPYFHLLTCSEELKYSPFESLISNIAQIPSDGLGICQVLFQPTRPENNWYRNVKRLTDLEYITGQISNLGTIQRYAQQSPSADLHNMATKMETKAHNDKPFFSVALRIAVLDTRENQKHLRRISVFTNLFQHGGKALGYLNDLDYKDKISIYQIKDMFTLGISFRNGFLLNSSELSGLAHIPPADIFENYFTSFDVLEPLATEKIDLGQGVLIGYAQIANRQEPVCIPDKIRPIHIHIIGKPGKGKSLLEKHTILNDINRGIGVALLDPHGDLAEELLDHIPEERIEKVIYFDPSDPNWVPIWNPMAPIAGQDIGRTTDDLVGVFKSFVTGWGDRMEHLLRHGIFGMKHIAGTSLLDVYELQQKGSKAGEVNRKLILDVVNSEVARQFWENDYLKYDASDFGPGKHKLSKLLTGGTVSLMLSQPHSLIDFTRIMNEGFIFIANLAGLGSEILEILGGFLVSVMHMTALGRSVIPVEKRNPFYIYLDEAHRFVTDSLEEIIAETRKYNVGLILAHQYLKQFTQKKIDALSNTGTTIVFNVDTRDASYLLKDFQEKLQVKDFQELDVGEAIVKIANTITKVKTQGPVEAPQYNFKQQIINNSRRLFCRPAEDVRKMIAKRMDRAAHPFTPLVDTDPQEIRNKAKKRIYDEFTAF
ncbi:MAG: hypothetical protein A2Y10_20315 [Planctomycetes bacterium GWF2_41_51]|nr:MAG: hypothetical protein A2Y10_20315 [Planctomycetes bacterium GWF2_41_51]HBG25740.1 hypothetical protein [Phycisphaerales bacterium]